MSVEHPDDAVTTIDRYRAAGVIEWRPVDTWSRRVGGLTSLPVLIAKLDFDLPHVMAAAGLPVDALSSADHRVPFEVIGRLLDAVTDMSGHHDFGLRLGSMIKLDDLGIIGDLARNATTLAEALQFMVVYQHLQSEGDLVFFARHDPIVEVGYAIYYPGVEGVDQMCDYALAALFTVLRELAGSQWLPSEVFVPHARPPQALHYENLFRALPHFNAEFCSLRFPAYWLNHPVQGADPAQRRRALNEVQQAADADLLHQVYRALRQLMLSNKSSGDDVADMLSMNRRTLNRRLRERGTTFQRVLDSVRCEVARQLLVHSQLPLEDVAASLGYAGASPFMRSFRRWTGSSPGDFRKVARLRKRPHISTNTSLNTLRDGSNADPKATHDT
ncbi:MAG TPA: AraC family transcriptional regulator [Casimicrobiaceae bacterium]|nr:AraC family transcriptional regulator [Casimicrobiaceae bacterium]